MSRELHRTYKRAYKCRYEATILPYKFINTALRYGNYEIANMITMINPMAKTIDSI